MVGVCQAEQLADDSLVAAAQSGSARAFDLRVVRHHAAILRYLARQTGDPELAADLAQEPFLDAFRSLDRLGDDRLEEAAGRLRQRAGRRVLVLLLPHRPQLRGGVLRVAGRGWLLAPAGLGAAARDVRGPWRRNSSGHARVCRGSRRRAAPRSTGPRA